MATGVIAFPPQKDAYISQYYPSKNYGNSSYLYANRYKTAEDSYRTLIKFDLCSLGCNYIPPNSNIETAYLQLTIYRNEVPVSTPLYVYRIDQHWEETTVTWNNQPVYYNAAYGNLPINAGNTGNILINITNLVNGWYNGTLTNNGLLLKCDESYNSLLGFYGKGFYNTSYRPRLVVYYSEYCCVV